MSDPILKQVRAILDQHDTLPSFSKGDVIAAFRALLSEHQSDTHHMDMCQVCAVAGAALADPVTQQALSGDDELLLAAQNFVAACSKRKAAP